MIFRQKMRYRLLPVAVGCLMLSAVLGLPAPAAAYDSDAALERDGALCTRQVARAERKYGIPQRLLGAIAATETGRRHKGLGVQIPWPWSINVEGRPFLYHTKREAVIAVEQFQAQGVRSIDVGCMQVNLHHHPKAFANLSQAFEPSFNVDYAARFLRGHYDETQSWKTAVGRYHSRTPGHAARYVGAVYGHWYGLATGGSRQATQQQAGQKYKSYIRMENTGEQKDLKARERYVITAAKTATPQQDTVSSAARVVKPATRESSAGRMDISIIRPTSSAGKIASTPTVDTDAASGPLVMNAVQKEGEFTEKGFTNPSSAANHSRSGRAEEDSRFIRFAD